MIMMKWILKKQHDFGIIYFYTIYNKINVILNRFQKNETIC